MGERLAGLKVQMGDFPDDGGACVGKDGGRDRGARERMVEEVSLRCAGLWPLVGNQASNCSW